MALLRRHEPQQGTYDDQRETTVAMAMASPSLCSVRSSVPAAMARAPSG